MVSRRNLKSVHENSVLRQFTEYLASNGAQLDVLGRPEPPEAIVELNGKRTWIEVTDAFLDKEHAISLTSGASDDVEHVPDDRRLIIDPDEKFSAVLRSAVEAKYDKASMQAIAASQGSGILLVGIFTPFTTAAAVAHEEAETIANLVLAKPIQVFEIIYAYEGTGQRSFHVLFRKEGLRG